MSTKGGKRIGSGRKKGSTSRPVLREYFTEKEIKDFITDLKESAKTDMNIKKFVAEQLFGKAIQPVEGDFKGDLTVTFDNAFISTTEEHSS